MLGPAEEHPIGSVEWAERIGHRLQIHIKRVKRNEEREVKYLPPVLEAILDAEPRPWTVWPPDNPCRTPEAWFQTVTGARIGNIKKLIEAYEPGSPLIRKLETAEAEDNPVAQHGEIGRGRTENRVARSHSNKASSTSTKRILARLARDRPDLLAAYERGELKSARAAGIAAGFIKPLPLLDRVRKLVPQLTDIEWGKFKREEDQRRSAQPFKLGDAARGFQ